MKTCPHCEGELRDSVIRCTHCGRSLREAPETDLAAAGATSAWARPASPAPAAWPSPLRAAARPLAPPDALANRPTSPLADPSQHRALPSASRSWGPDMWMLWAGMATVGAGILAHLAVKEPWAHLTVTQAGTDFEDAVVVQVTLRAQAAFIGSVGSVLAIALAVLGALWFLFGLQRGWTMPSITNPALAIVVTVVGLGLTVLSSVVWFVWEDAMVLRANAAGISAGEMQDLLDRQPPPLVEIERLSGLLSFGGMMLLGLFAACLAWWDYRRRD